MGYKTLSITDSVNACDCCGKQNLKQTVAMESDAGELVHFGTVCAARHSGRDSKAIKSEAKAAYDAKVEAAKKEFNASTEAIASNARYAEAYALKINVGKEFREFTRAASSAAEMKRHAIAAKYSLSAYAI